MHVGHNSVEMSCGIGTQIVHANLVAPDMCDVVFHRIRSKNRHFPRAMGLDVLEPIQSFKLGISGPGAPSTVIWLLCKYLALQGIVY